MKQKLLGIIVCIVLFSNLANAFVQLKMEDSFCTTDQGFKIKVSNLGDEPIDTKKIKTIVNLMGLYQDYTLDKDDLDPRGINSEYDLLAAGVWNPISIQASEYATFISDDDLLTYPGKYRISVYYDGCKYVSFKGCKSDVCIPQKGECYAETILSCVGKQEYGCYALNTNIESCTNYEDHFEMKFKGLDKGLFDDVDPKKEADYTFFGSKTTYDSKQGLPEDLTVKEIEEDTYVLKFGLDDNNYVDRVRIYNWACGKEVFAKCSLKTSQEVIDTEKQIDDLQKENEDYKEQLEVTKADSKSFYGFIGIVLLIILILVGYNIYHTKKIKKHLKLKS